MRSESVADDWHSGSAPGNAETLERQAVRKAIWRLMPILALAFLFNFLDRTSVGFAALTMNRDLGLTATAFGWGAGILFAGYCLFEVPSNLILYRVGARRWLARIMISWGIVAAATAFAQGPMSFYAIRFLLGVAEAGFFPGVIYYLSIWFPAEHRARVLALFTAAIPLSSLVGGPISGALLEMDGLGGLAGWQWMFLIEGLPTCFIGLITLKVLTDEPKDANWLTVREKSALMAKLALERRDQRQTNFLVALKDPRILVLSGITFCFTVGSYGVGIWLPQILKSHALSNLEIGFLSAVPYIFSTAGMIAWAWHIDRSGRSIKNLALACCVAATGLVFSVAYPALWPALIGLTIALIGSTSARTIFYTIPPRFLAGAAAAGGLAFVNSIGSLGGFFGPFLMGWLKDLTGSYSAGLLGMAAILLSAVGLTLSLRLFIRD